MTVRQRCALAIVSAIYGAANFVLLSIRRVLWLRRHRATPQAICIYRIGNVGDIVCALPAMRAVRASYPEARLVLLTSPGNTSLPGARELLEGNGWIDELLVYHESDLRNPKRLLMLIKRLQKERFDLWIELPGSLARFSTLLRNMLFARLVRAKWGCGWRLSTIRLWRQLQSEYRAIPKEVTRLLRVLSDEDIAVDSVDFGLAISPESHKNALAILSRAGVSDGESFVVLAPGAKRSTNRWHPHRWTDVGKDLVSQGFKVLLVGAPSEGPLCSAIAESVGPAAASIAGETTLATLPHILRHCAFAVCVDSGIQHIASAVGTRCISLFAARDFLGKWHPYGDHIVIEKRVACHTCLLEHCPHENRCMSDIQVTEVTTACRQSARLVQSVASREAGKRAHRAPC